jgi:hypothetical protein
MAAAQHATLVTRRVRPGTAVVVNLERRVDEGRDSMYIVDGVGTPTAVTVLQSADGKVHEVCEWVNAAGKTFKNGYVPVSFVQAGTSQDDLRHPGQWGALSFKPLEPCRGGCGRSHTYVTKPRALVPITALNVEQYIQ